MGILRPTFGGTRFGSSRPMLPTAHARRRERRRGFAEMLAMLARTLERRSEVAFMRGQFEEALRRLVPVQSVRLRDAAHRWPLGPVAVEPGQNREVIAIEVAGGDPLS